MNRRFGKLVAVTMIGTDSQGAKWRSQCDCNGFNQRYAQELLRGMDSRLPVMRCVVVATRANAKRVKGV